MQCSTFEPEPEGYDQWICITSAYTCMARRKSLAGIEREMADLMQCLCVKLLFIAYYSTTGGGLERAIYLWSD